ncbi:ribosome biogenesis factor YjgA [Alkalimarinus coralli]|uniref:ribosome biogenesis factor YjgA n=1 Tax=Alkalimarinus coralli TaxID=2935863 RepID=UPI00202B8273|nr:ribosome biogenesis factor YjgA [Alkalimarinus coralli]
MTDFDLPEEFDEENIVSKTSIKRDMHKLQALGKRLTELKPNQLEKVPMSETLRKAIDESQRITQREATRRHMQYIGKLMRAEDAEAIQNAVDLFDASSKAFAQALHSLERWRDRLIEGGNETLSEYIHDNPNADIQHLRQLVRNAKKDLKNEKNTGASKKLFRYLRTIDDMDNETTP